MQPGKAKIADTARSKWDKVDISDIEAHPHMLMFIVAATHRLYLALRELDALTGFPQGREETIALFPDIDSGTNGNDELREALQKHIEAPLVMGTWNSYIYV